MRQRTIHEHVEERHGVKCIRLNSGRLIGYWDARRAADRAETDLHRAISRSFKLVDSEYDLDRLESFVDDLHHYLYALDHEIEKRRGVAKVRERIAAMRITTGRTPAEAEAFHARADELERRLEVS